MGQSDVILADGGEVERQVDEIERLGKWRMVQTGGRNYKMKRRRGMKVCTC